MEMGSNESLGNSSRVRVSSPIEKTPNMVVRNNNVDIFKEMYRECLKNHSINHSGHSLDGCCEFLPAGPEGSLDALKCAACNCHRNFHRREPPFQRNVAALATPVPITIIPAGDAYPPYNHHHHQAAPPQQHRVYLGGGGCPSAPAVISEVGGEGGGKDHDDTMDADNGGIGTTSNSNKRFRTKFTREQKEKMKVFAERLDWRIQKQDDAVVQEFCDENSVQRQVLKVWMNNNKHTIGKKP